MINHVIVFNYFRPNVSTAFKECVFASQDEAKIKNWLDQAEARREKYFNLPMLPVFLDEYDPTISYYAEQKQDHYVIIHIEDNI